MEQNNSERNKSNINPKVKENSTFILLCLCYVLACVYIPFAFFVDMGDWLSLAAALAVCAISGVALTRMAGGFKPIGGFAIVIGIFVFLGGAVLPVALFVAFVSATCIYAGLILTGKLRIVWILPTISIIIIFFTTRSLAGVMLSLATLPCSALLAVSIKRKLPRVSAICRISAGICIFAVVAFALAVYDLTGELNPSAVSALIDSAKTQATLMLDSAIAETSELLGGELIGSDVTNIIDLAVSSVFNLLPAIVITVANILSYVIHSLFMTVHFTTEEQKKQSLHMLTFDMSLTSGVVYIAALVLSLALVTDDLAMYGTAAKNVMLVLAPGLVLTALAGIRALTLRKGPSCLGTILYIGVIFMLASLSLYVIAIVALAGAVLTIVAHVAANKIKKN